MFSTGILFALTCAAVWGTADFAGGSASRRSHPFQVLALSALSGIVLLAVLGALRETMPPLSDLAWAALGGLSGALGMASLYRGLAVGSAATVAPIAAVVTAALPVIFAAVTLGLPSARQVTGFVAAFAGIWLVTRTPTDQRISQIELRLAVLAGVGFGGFLILIAQVESALVFVPLAMARTVTFATAVVLMMGRGVPFPSLTSNHLALLAGALDAGGNIFYVLARHQTRLDIAAVLSSLYPVATVALARLVQQQPVTPTQWIGVVVCLVSVALMASE